MTTQDTGCQHGKIKSDRRGNTRRHFEENKTTVAEKRIAREALMWYPEQGKRRPRKSWTDRLTDYLHNISMTWDDFGEVADDRC